MGSLGPNFEHPKFWTIIKLFSSKYVLYYRPHVEEDIFSFMDKLFFQAESGLKFSIHLFLATHIFSPGNKRSILA